MFVYVYIYLYISTILFVVLHSWPKPGGNLLSYRTHIAHLVEELRGAAARQTRLGGGSCEAGEDAASRAAEFGCAKLSFTPLPS